jgi:hypothetical protein
MVDIFINNKYSTWYYNIINNSKNRLLTGYKEKHHIIPRCLGGKDTKDNLAILTAREHFIVHMLLCKFTTGQIKMKMAYAFHAMCTFKNAGRYNKVNSRLVDKIRNEFSLMLRGTKFSKETKTKMSEVKKGKPSNRKGKKASYKTIEKLKLINLGRKASEKTLAKLRLARKDIIWIIKEKKEQRIKKHLLQEYLDKGYKVGRNTSFMNEEYKKNMSKTVAKIWQERRLANAI